MSISERDLAVARAVLRAYIGEPDEIDEIAIEDAMLTCVPAAITAIPEPDPLPAPTGPGFWWARYAGGVWKPCEVFDDEGALIVYLPGGDMDYGIGDFDAWLPLVPPGGGE